MKDIKTAEEVIQDDLNLITTDKDLQYLFIGVCEKYHKAKIESISDEEIEELEKEIYKTAKMGQLVITAINKYKNKLLNDL